MAIPKYAPLDQAGLCPYTTSEIDTYLLDMPDLQI